MIAWSLVLLLATTETPGTSASCFPSEAAVDEFHTEWYCKHLKAAGLGLLVPGPSYRFTYLPTFDSPRVVTVALEEARPVVRGVVLSGKGGYDPGKVVKETRRVLSKEEWYLLRQRLENAGIWEPTDVNDSNGVDGAQWILEGRQGDTYRLHDVWSPQPARFPQYLKVCVYMLDLAGIKPDAKELY